MNKILVIGSTNIDMIACVKHLPRPGETVGEARFMQSNGGKGANQAVAAARLGGYVAFVSCLGDDAGAAALRQQFAADGINPDMFGDAYEYLMGMYAANAGKKGGQYFTPADVSELLARLGTIGKTKVNKVYDIKTPRLIQFNFSSTDFAA